MSAKAIIYTRDKHYKHSLPQNDHTGMAAYAVMHNLDVVEDFCEEEAAGRPRYSALSKALDAIQRTGAKFLLVESLTDLADAIPIQEILIEAARRCGASVVNIRQSRQVDEERIHIRAALELLNRQERKILGARLQAARIKARSGDGRREGRKPYGFSKNPEEALFERKVLLQIHELRNQGMSFRKIADQLNKEGIRPRKGRCWWGKTISLILKNAGPSRKDDLVP